MKHISNIRDLKVMYITTSIGLISFIIGANNFGLDKVFQNNNSTLIEMKNGNHYIYSIIISEFGGTAHIKYDKELHYFLKLNELLYDNLEDKEKIIKKTNIGKSILDDFNENTMKLLLGKGDKNKYYSLIFLSVPFALKIHDKNKLVTNLYKFLSDITNNLDHILATITCALFINYALNDIKIEKWIKNINEDLNNLNDNEKYLDSLNNYYELNFRNNQFIHQKIEYIVEERNKNFLNNYCTKNNRILTEHPVEQVLLIYDTIIRSENNWEKLILFGMVNFNDNISISIIIGALYEILFSSRKVNKNLIKRFSF